MSTDQPRASLMPTGATAARVMDQRARHLSQPEERPTAELDRDLYIRFRLGPAEEYGIPYRWLEEILHLAPLARVPGVPAFIAGVMNRRGEMLTVLDLRRLFGIPASVEEAEPTVIVASAGGLTVGLLVDHLFGNAPYDPDRLNAALPSAGISNPAFVEGIDGGRVTILNLQALLADPVLRVAREQ